MMKKKFLAVAVLAGLSAGSHAKIYPDQLVKDSLGDDVCRSGYRPIDHFEASTHRDYLVARMGQWEVAGLKDNWVIMGSGYNGEIKQDYPNSNTWCHPVSDQAKLPEYSPRSVEEGSELDVQYSLVNNFGSFVRPLSYLAHNLGYAWLSGNNGQYVAEDMNVWRSGDKWYIQGNNNGSCSGYRCDDKTKITINNFAYTLNEKDFWHGQVVESGKQLVKTLHATAINHNDTPQQVVVDLKADESTNWSKTNTFGFAEKVQTENTFKWPLVGETKIAISLEANQSFSNTNGGLNSEQVTLQARPMLPARSAMPIKVELYRSSISYPYRFGADISYDVNFNGFLRWSGNAWHTHPDNRPYKSYTFTMGRSSAPANDIRYQWNHRYIPGEVKWWDWSWAIEQNGLSSMQYAAGRSLRPFYSHVSGDFYAESQYAGTIDLGKAYKIGAKTRVQRSEPLRGENAGGGIEIISNFDAEELKALGFGNAEFTVKPVE
ncbi:aerolysin family beta-barrel pore-forming toxin [Spartinivicinus ruber]|uniref:aerolysin family beta-barrel pore-forming toxin n=1 Tax=Spartinivicinus ruber TaxID=2683272 RepID=UPI0013D65E66|nr:aerolysin family beta-barrel pore-forming toxin [Spartinivicinus ruber]